MNGVEDALAAIDSWVADGLVPAVAAVVVDARGVLAERYAGVRERGGDEPVGPGTLFALASLTKPLVAAACMVALEEGLLDLDAEVRDGFTLRHLLSHCAGLPEAGLAWREPPEYPPGTQRWYSNAGYVQAARLLEAASGMSCADYLAEAVLAPLGMDASLGLQAADEAARRSRLAGGALRRRRAVQLRELPPRRAAAGRRLCECARLRRVPLLPARGR